MALTDRLDPRGMAEIRTSSSKEYTNVERRRFVVARTIKVIVEEHPDGFLAYPVGLRGVVVGEGPSAEAALADVQSAIQFHLETFGADALDTADPVLNIIVREAHV